MSIRILLVADSEIVRQGLMQMLESAEGMEVVADCASAEEALSSSRMERLYPNIVVMDMPETNGGEDIRILKRKSDYLADVIILSESPDYLDEALKAGAAICLPKNITGAKLTHAIRQVYQDRNLLGAVELAILPPSNAARLLRFICQLEDLLHDNSAGIVSMVGSWDRGLVIKVKLEPTTASSLPIKLSDMPEVEKVEEQALAGFALKRFSITLKE